MHDRLKTLRRILSRCTLNSKSAGPGPPFLVAQARGKADEVSRRNIATTADRLYENFDSMTLGVVKANEG